MAEAHPALSPQNIKLKAQFTELGAKPFYEKCLTNSDTGAQGRVVIPKAVAESQFGDLLEKQGATLVGEDVNGIAYEFKFRFWTNNQSRMYLIEGCSELLKKYKLSFGDVIVFARKDDGTLVIGGRPAGPEDTAKRPVVRARPSGKGDERGKPVKKRKDQPLTDGTFRAYVGADAASQRVFLDGACWACIIHIAGEAYKALFDFESDAWAAYRAACPADAEQAAACASNGAIARPTEAAVDIQQQVQQQAQQQAMADLLSGGAVAAELLEATQAAAPPQVHAEGMNMVQ